MKLVGARWGFIRRPFLMRGFWVGVASALIADAVILSGIYWAATYDAAILRYVTEQNIIITTVAVFGIGLILTLVCTYFSVTHCLKMRGSELY